ncbi:Hypothetical predicted protein [Cloeon dipterum]|uniref:Uncharacterized protein n=1 Tax=Cloeon dipterum TaxID=197152 RepID=A0A8S1C1T8_9INSE|nr:Hypothetical predicted protein [Cloeon dipterum]
MLVAVLLVSLLASTGGKSHFVNHPHIPWLAVQVASEAAASEATIDDCRSSSAAFLQLLLHAKSSKEAAQKIMNEFDKSSEVCPTRLSVSMDNKRMPQLLVHVQCSCEGRRCHILGGYYCTTVLGSVDILRLGSNKKMIPSHEVVPVGCVCMQRSSKKALAIQPNIENIKK